MKNRSGALLLFSESMHNADMFYATRFLSADPFIYLSTCDTELIVVPQMEVERAKSEANVTEVHSLLEYGEANEKIEVIIAELLRDKGVNEVRVPQYFPVFIADFLRERGISVEVVEDVMPEREVKRDEEVEMMKKAQRACEYAMSVVINCIKKSGIRDGVLVDERGVPLTAERLKLMIEHALIDCGCVVEYEPIVACGKGGANPHWTGSGEILANEPIIIDIFPRLRRERYFADMTRTVVRGEPSSEVKEMFDAVKEAQEAAISFVRAGVTCADVHNLVCDILEKHGYDTLRRASRAGRAAGKSNKTAERNAETPESSGISETPVSECEESEESKAKEKSERAARIRKGFLHATGHGVGLALHEKPSVSDNDYTLKSGNVITIEPGLYDPNVGGVRIEDMVLVRENSCENLTRFEKTLVL